MWPQKQFHLGLGQWLLVAKDVVQRCWIFCAYVDAPSFWLRQKYNLLNRLFELLQSHGNMKGRRFNQCHTNQMYCHGVIKFHLIFLDCLAFLSGCRGWNELEQPSPLRERVTGHCSALLPSMQHPGAVSAPCLIQSKQSFPQRNWRKSDACGTTCHS